MTRYGYPLATTGGIGAAVVGLDSDWDVIASVANTSITYSFSGSTDTTCAVTYTQASGTSTASAASTTVATGGCN